MANLGIFYRWRAGWQHALAALLTALTPALVAALLLAGWHGQTLAGYVPVTGDEIFHWHQPASFARVGFQNGYYTMDEATPTAAFARYYAWGLAAPVLYGTAAALVGYGLAGGVLMNIVIFSAAVLAFIYVARLALWQMAWLALLLALYPPLLLYLPLHMLEPLHQAFGLVLAGGFYRLLRGTASPRLQIALGLLLLLAGWFRVSWVVLWLPFWLLVLPGRPRRALLLTGLFSAAQLIFYDLTAAPYLYALSVILAKLPQSPETAFWLYISHVRLNLLQLAQGFPFEVLLRLQLAVLLLAALWQQVRRAGPADDREWLLHVFNAASALGLIVLVYNTGDLVDFRALAAYGLFSSGLLVAYRRWRWLALLVLSLLPVLPATLSTGYRWTAAAYTTITPAQIDSWAQRLRAEGIQYRPQADPWCNTVTFSFAYLFKPELLLALEPGLGISIVRFDADGPFRAAYLILNAADAAAYRQPHQLRRLYQSHDLTIDRNLATPCP
ncbi:MAG: hypothetical protein MUE40_13040 [Anaerolineae bacterium]|jgi:hypothetical protein|nr:hypothetical protein [Anaerolineae bacterium]